MSARIKFPEPEQQALRSASVMKGEPSQSTHALSATSKSQAIRGSEMEKVPPVATPVVR